MKVVPIPKGQHAEIITHNKQTESIERALSRTLLLCKKIKEAQEIDPDTIYYDEYDEPIYTASQSIDTRVSEALILSSDIT